MPVEVCVSLLGSGLFTCPTLFSYGVHVCACVCMCVNQHVHLHMYIYIEYRVIEAHRMTTLHAGLASR